jgi:hypothetical protein
VNQSSNPSHKKRVGFASRGPLGCPGRKKDGHIPRNMGRVRASTDSVFVDLGGLLNAWDSPRLSFLASKTKKKISFEQGIQI